MDFICGTLCCAAVLGLGFYQMAYPFYAWLFGVDDEDEDHEDWLEDDEFTEEELYGDEVEEPYLQWGEERTPVDVRALLESSLPDAEYHLFHDVTFTPESEKEPRQIDHIVVCAQGVFCIRALQLDGEILADEDLESDWGLQVSEDAVLDWIPNPVGEIRQTARRLARSIGLKPNQVVGIVAQAGKGWFEGGHKTPGSYYASDLTLTFERRKKLRLSDEEIERVCARFREGLT